jgi:plastocyanin
MNIIKILAVASLATIASCGSSNSTGPNYGGGSGNSCTPGAGTVCLVSSNQFSPSQITVTAGSNVTFNNVSGTTHNVTFTTTGAPANVDDFATGTKAVAFPTAGTYDYHCTIHGLSMSGVVVVQ